MKTKRNARTDPHAADVLKYGKWIITVSRREPENVYYYAHKTGDRVDPREKSQSLAEWQKWSVLAKIKIARKQDGCVISLNVSGPCAGCAAQIVDGAHLGDGTLRCGVCCTLCKPKAVAA